MKAKALGLDDENLDEPCSSSGLVRVFLLFVFKLRSMCLGLFVLWSSSFSPLKCCL